MKIPRCDRNFKATVRQKERKMGFTKNQCITKTEKAESEAQRSKPKGTLESESRNAIL